MDEEEDLDPIAALMKGADESGERSLPVPPRPPPRPSSSPAMPSGAFDSGDMMLMGMVADADGVPPAPAASEPAPPPAALRSGVVRPTRAVPRRRRPVLPLLGLAIAAVLCVVVALQSPPPTHEGPPMTGAEGAERLVADLEASLGREDPVAAARKLTASLARDPRAWLAPYQAPDLPGWYLWGALLRDVRGLGRLGEGPRRSLERLSARLATANRVLRDEGLPPAYPHARRWAEEEGDPAGALARLEKAAGVGEGARRELLERLSPGNAASTAAPLLELMRTVRVAEDSEKLAGALERLFEERFRLGGAMAFFDPALALGGSSIHEPERSPVRLAEAMGWIIRSELYQALGVPDPDALRRAARRLLPGLPAGPGTLGRAWTEAASVLYGLVGRAELARAIVREYVSRMNEQYPGQVDTRGMERELDRVLGRDPSRPGKPWPVLTVSMVGLLPAVGDVPEGEGGDEGEAAGWRYRPPDTSAASRYTRTRRRRGGGGSGVPDGTR